MAVDGDQSSSEVPMMATPPVEAADEKSKPVWCVVANVLFQRPYGPGGLETRPGTKHFVGGSKVYVVLFYWGMGAESVTVIGRHRKSKRYICIDMASKDLANWRVELVYSPYVIRQVWERGVTKFWVPGEKKWIVGPDTEYAKREAEDNVLKFMQRASATQPYITRPPVVE